MGLAGHYIPAGGNAGTFSNFSGQLVSSLHFPLKFCIRGIPKLGWGDGDGNVGGVETGEKEAEPEN